MTTYDTFSDTKQTFFTQVLLWLTGSFIAMAVGIALAYFIPGVASLAMPLYLVVLVVLLVSAFSRGLAYKLAEPLAILVPAILGAATYPVLELYVASGAGNLIVEAAIGAIGIFGAMAVWAWKSKAQSATWGNKLFFITLGLVVMSLLNAFVFHSSWGSFLISLVVVVVFSFWSFYDIQQLKNADGVGDKPALHALNIWLDLWNLFINLLNVLSRFRD